MTKKAGSGLVRGMDPRIRIHPKMSWILNTALSLSTDPDPDPDPDKIMPIRQDPDP
jgi:hypothetical protein